MKKSLQNHSAPRNHTSIAKHASLSLLAASLLASTPVYAQSNPDTLLWGDTHLHTNLSTDAYFLGNRSSDADTAYRFAKGEPVIHPYHRAKMQLQTPLDFLAVTDHAQMLGMPYSLLSLKDSRLANTRLGKKLIELNDADRGEEAFGLFITAINLAGMEDAERPPKVTIWTVINWKISDLFKKPDSRARAIRWIASDPTLMSDLQNKDIFTNHWHSVADAAERHNDPGNFTALIGWEYTPTPNGANLHRVVFTPDNAEKAKQFLPFSSADSGNPEDLWRWLSDMKETHDVDFVSIPHNSNISKAKMFARIDTAGNPINEDYARLRSTWEQVAEVTQIKGTSETHPLLSPDDEFAGFEFFNRLIESRPDAQHEPTVTEADYVRSALKTGLEIENQIGINPYKLGMIGATDSHSGLSTAEEDNFMGKMAIDSIPENKEHGLGEVSGWEMSASGLAAVWARENTREEITNAFKRREVYGTTGPRIALRFFGGYNFQDTDLSVRDLATPGYQKGVPMGGDLSSAGENVPSFLLHAVKDPKGANLDRIQIVKGWLGSDGKAQEKVYNVAWSGDRTADNNGNIAPVGDSVNHKTAAYKNSIGTAELTAIWHDPAFDPASRAFYYLRVLQIPTPRNSLYDSVALQATPPEGYPEVIQERAYSSPIWYTPQ